MTRHIPIGVRRQLRREVNWGCPVRGCGNPYLTYHHFDPPFETKAHHDPDGMIALCAHHHAMADHTVKSTGRFSVEQLRNLKTAPYVSGLIRSTLEPLDKAVLLICGGLWGICDVAQVTVGQLPLFGLHYDDEQGTAVDCLLADKDGRRAVFIDGGDLEAPVELLEDLSFTLRSQEHSIALSDGARVRFTLARPDRDTLLSEIVNGWLSDDQLCVQLGALERYSRTWDLPRIAEEAARFQLQVFLERERLPNEHELQVVTVSARVPVVDGESNRAWVCIEPWTIDLELQKGVSQFSNAIGGHYRRSTSGRIRGPRINPMEFPVREFHGNLVSLSIGALSDRTANPVKATEHESFGERVRSLPNFIPTPIPAGFRVTMCINEKRRWAAISSPLGGDWPSDESHAVVRAAVAFDACDWSAAIQFAGSVEPNDPLRLYGAYLAATWSVGLLGICDGLNDDDAERSVVRVLQEARNLDFPGRCSITSIGEAVATGLHDLRDWLTSRDAEHPLGRRDVSVSAKNRARLQPCKFVGAPDGMMTMCSE